MLTIGVLVRLEPEQAVTRGNTYQVWQTTALVETTGLVMVQGQLVMVKVVGYFYLSVHVAGFCFRQFGIGEGR